MAVKNFSKSQAKCSFDLLATQKNQAKNQAKISSKEKATINFYEATLYTPVSFKSEDSEQFLFTDIVLRQQNLTWYFFHRCFQWNVTRWCCRCFAYHFTNHCWSSKFSNTCENRIDWKSLQRFQFTLCICGNNGGFHCPIGLMFSQWSRWTFIQTSGTNWCSNSIEKNKVIERMIEKNGGNKRMIFTMRKCCWFFENSWRSFHRNGC